MDEDTPVTVADVAKVVLDARTETGATDWGHPLIAEILALETELDLEFGMGAWRRPEFQGKTVSTEIEMKHRELLKKEAVLIKKEVIRG